MPLVDDAASIRNALRGVLEDAGIEVVGEAPDGIQGVAMVDSLRPDVVLMDLRMPTANGFQATEQIVQEHPAVRVVVLSAYETEESAEAVRAAGAFAFPSTAAPTASERPWRRPGGPAAAAPELSPDPCGGASSPTSPKKRLCQGTGRASLAPWA